MEKTDVKEKRLPTLWEALTPMVAMVVILTYGYGKLHYPSEALLILVTIVAMFIANRLGYSWDDCMDEITNKIKKASSSILIMIVVGGLIATWEASGTIPMIIYYGVQIINPRYMLATSFVICAIVSMCTGTSRGSVGTMGVALIGISVGLGISLPATAGAIISGAYFGDKLSPLSDTTVLAPTVAGCNIYDHIHHMLWTTIPASVIALAVYLFAGISGNISTYTTPEALTNMVNTLDTMYNWSVILLLPVFIVLIGSVLKKPTVPVMVLSCIVAGILAVCFQDISIADVFKASVKGFNATMIHAAGFSTKMISPSLAKLINRGGMAPMMSMLLLLFCAFVFAGIMSKTKCLDVILNKMLTIVTSTGGLIASTLASCILMALTTGSAYLSIIIPGEMFSDTYKKKGLDPVNLSRTLEDAGTMFGVLVPWSSSAAFMIATLGVQPVEYAPWAVLNYMGIIVALIYGYTGIGIKKLPSAE
jgi:NhaC family Na+:H+ antiporter